MKRYIVNLATGVIHDRENLTENCNTDDIKARGEADPEDITEDNIGLGTMLIGDMEYDKCEWCFK